MKCKFYVERGRWYFKKEEMISGADTLLDFIADGDVEMTLEIKTAPFEGGEEMKYQNMGGEHSFAGAYYYVENYKGLRIDLVVWLSDDFLFLFEENTIPNLFYFKKL